MVFKNKIILAPLADINDIAFRTMCKRYGADITFSEMINCNALARNNKSTLKMIDSSKEEKQFAIQLFGTKLENIKKAVKVVDNKCDIIDFNLGCPASRIIRQGAGCALMKRPKKVFDIIEMIVSLTDRPVTAKIRSGYKRKNFIEIAEQIEKAGASAITLHPRTMSQGYSGKADWRCIKELKDNSGIPVIGNGDIWNEDYAKRMLDETDCNSIMIGRAAIGNPFIFRSIRHYLDTGKKLEQLNKNQKIRMYFEYLELFDKYNLKIFPKAKQQALYFLKGFEGSAKIRNKIAKIKDMKELKKEIKELY